MKEFSLDLRTVIAERWEEISRVLPVTQAEVIALNFGIGTDPLTLSEIARRLCLTRQAINLRYWRGMKRIRRLCQGLPAQWFPEHLRMKGIP